MEAGKKVFSYRWWKEYWGLWLCEIRDVLRGTQGKIFWSRPRPLYPREGLFFASLGLSPLLPKLDNSASARPCAPRGTVVGDRYSGYACGSFANGEIYKVTPMFLQHSLAWVEGRREKASFDRFSLVFSLGEIGTQLENVPPNGVRKLGGSAECSRDLGGIGQL